MRHTQRLPLHACCVVAAIALLHAGGCLSVATSVTNIQSKTIQARTCVHPLLRVIASLKGAIRHAQMNPHAMPLGLVALTIEGKSATDPAYPLR